MEKTYQDVLDDQSAEIAQLEKKVQSWEFVADVGVKEIAALKTELSNSEAVRKGIEEKVERLKDQMKAANAEGKRWKENALYWENYFHKQNNGLNDIIKAEVERLRDAILTWQEQWRDASSAAIKHRNRAEALEKVVEEVRELMKRRFDENGCYDYMGLLLERILSGAKEMTP